MGFMKSTYGHGPRVTLMTYILKNYVGVGAGILDIQIIFSVGLFIDFEGEPAAGPVFVGLADRGDDERLHIVTADPDGVDVGEGLLG